MKALLRVSRAIDALNARLGGLADWLIFISVLISAGNATVRYLLDYGSNAFLEIQWYLFGAAVFLGASYTLKRNEHVRVDIVYSHLSERGLFTATDLAARHDAWDRAARATPHGEPIVLGRDEA